MKDLKAIEIHVEVIKENVTRDMGSGAMYVEDKILELLILGKHKRVITISGVRYIQEE